MFRVKAHIPADLLQEAPDQKSRPGCREWRM